MVGFSAHFSIGLIVAVIFVLLDKKGRYRTLIVGGFAATLPDLDAPGIFFDLFEHRGFFHSLELWAIVSGLAIILAGISIYMVFRKVGINKIYYTIYDKLLYVGAFSIGWLTHLIADFGFTDYQGTKGIFYSATELQLEILDQVMGFALAFVLGAIIWFEVKDKEKPGEKKGSILYRAEQIRF
jgi:hypothetical protein